jgi:hypothetical protein
MGNGWDSLYLQHPLTGATLEPIGSRADGRPIWPILGGSQTSTEDKSGSGSGAQSGSGDDADDDSQSGAASGSDGDDDDDAQSGKSSDETVSRADYEAQQRRLAAADRRATELDKELKAIKDKDKSELERAREEAESATKQFEGLQSENRRLRLQVAFLSDSTVTWHSAEDALMHLERDDSVTIDDDGKVQGMAEAIKRLAKDKEYLVKKTATTGNGATGPSGQNVGGAGSGGGNKKTSRADYEKKFPALKR